MRAMLRRLTRAACISVHAPDGSHSYVAIFFILVLPNTVFAVRRMIARIATPLAYLLAGPLADDLFEPMLADGGALASTVGRVIGVGPGRGIAFLYVMLGV